MKKKSPPPPPPPRRSNFIMSKPNGWTAPDPAPRTEEEPPSEQSSQPPPSSPEEPVAPRAEESSQPVEPFESSLHLLRSTNPEEPGLSVPSAQELQQYAQTSRRQLSPLQPKNTNHRRHPKWRYLVQICGGDVATAERLVQFDDVEKAIWKLTRDRH